ncbi:ATP-binding protein [Faecalibacillus faecis]|uniref:ATP-binding protein n=1 Tax=Faecalibacillus faecis TaxID=1982628 RepID=UPI003863A382
MLLVILPITPVATYLIDINSIPRTLLQFLIVCLQCFFAHFLFRIKRFKNGIPLLRNPFASKIGLLLGGLILFFNMFSSTFNYKIEHKHDFFAILLIPSSLILIILFFIWWQNEIQHSYLLQVKEQECRRLEEQLSYCQEKINVLEKDNTELSKLIHRDNKLIPSMQLAVHSFLNQIADNSTADLSEEGKTLILQLETEMMERSNYVDTLSKTQKQLPATGIFLIDQLLAYFLQRCNHTGIAFDCSFFGNVSSIVENPLSEKELSTLLADLLENALIATKHNQGKNILLHMGILNNCFFLEVWDNGEKFPKEVLYHLGHKKYTTHKQDGGSGIGMMVTYEMLQKYHGSFLIDETVFDKSFCTKKLIVIFDKKSRYHLYSKRSAEELVYLSKRRDLEIFPEVPDNQC